MPQLRQNDDSSMGIEGASGLSKGGFVAASYQYTASAVNTFFFTADRPYVVQGIRGAAAVAGTGGTCTVQVLKVTSGTVLTSGTAVHSGSFNVVGTINTPQALTLSTTVTTLLMQAGDSLAFVLTGTPTSAVGSITVNLAPA